MKETDLTKLESSLETSLNEYGNMGLPDNKTQACQILMREIATISNEKKRISDEKSQAERFELEKDHRYWSEKLEDKKFDLDKEKENFHEKIELMHIDLEKTKIDLEKSNLEFNKQLRKDEQKFKWISLGVTVIVPAVVSLITVCVYRKLAYANLSLIYKDEGRPTVDFKDSVKNIKGLIK